jgi:two-component system OmpR family response regulator
VQALGRDGRATNKLWTSAATAPQRAPTVIVIDANQKVRELVVHTLLRHGFRVPTVNDYASGLAQAEAGAADVVLLDPMPLSWEAGLAVCRQIRQRSKTPVLLLTSSCLDQDICHALAAGAADVICKPFSPQDLVMRVAAVVNQPGSAAARRG